MKTVKIYVPTSQEEVEYEKISDLNIRARFDNYDGYGVDEESAFADLLNNMPIGPEVVENQFPNGFTSWYETHYVVSIHLFETVDTVGTIAFEQVAKQGIGGLWELSCELTDEFELLNKDRQWDGEWMDELHVWLNKRNEKMKIDKK